MIPVINQNATFKYQWISYFVNYGVGRVGISILRRGYSTLLGDFSDDFLQIVAPQSKIKRTAIFIMFLVAMGSIFLFGYIMNFNLINV